MTMRSIAYLKMTVEKLLDSTEVSKVRELYLGGFPGDSGMLIEEIIEAVDIKKCETFKTRLALCESRGINNFIYSKLPIFGIRST